jgi:Mn2+/Fe2+ NRAMP family transporter
MKLQHTHDRKRHWHQLRLALGPGLLLAGAAIGVSHLVQATRAGAEYGFSLFWVLALAILTKYPFLEFGPRFAAATGEHMITGYHRMGAFAVTAYMIITVGSMFIIQAAVTLVTAGLAEQFFQLNWSMSTWSGFLLLTCILLLAVGRYPGLDISMKIIISVLSLCTLAAVLMALGTRTVREVWSTPAPSYWNAAGLTFIIAFMGWMPIPLDASIWHSMWTKARARQTAYAPSVRDARFDFDVGYGAAAVIGVLFFLLGSLIMFGKDTEFATSSVAFAGQIVELYSQALGAWSAPLISIAALVAMFSTTLAVTDVYPRVMSEVSVEWVAPARAVKIRPLVYMAGLVLIPGTGWFIIVYMTGAFTQLVDIAAGFSFIAAPVLGWFNLKLVCGPQMPAQARPGRAYLLFARACLIFLCIFTLVWFYWQFLPHPAIAE